MTRYLDGNEAAASVAYRLSEILAIYPITPASSMAEHCDAWAAEGRPNLFGQVPEVIEMQSEAGAAGVLHGAVQGGALGSTFTSSQGLLLMIPEMYKLAGELSPVVIHVAARALATHALSIFGDHSDVMAARGTGFAMLASSGVQEAADLSAIAHAVTLARRVPFLHFFDGFRTSHEVNACEVPGDRVLQALITEDAISVHRERGLSPEHPVIRGTAQNPDVFFQAREAASPFHAAIPDAVAWSMERFAGLTGRRYRPFEYVGHAEAERVVVVMGSGADTVAEAVRRRVSLGERVGMVQVRLYRPFSTAHLFSVLPRSVSRIAVLDRTKEPGAPGEPLYLDVAAAVARERPGVTVVGGRYGLGSKEFTPGMALSVLHALEREAPPHGFTVGIRDDVSGTSLPHAAHEIAEPADEIRVVQYGLGSDGTVGAAKAFLGALENDPGRFAQGYFVYDSKKAGATTVSHLRFGPRPIRRPYLVREAHFIACHDPRLLSRQDLFAGAAPGATVLLNHPGSADAVWGALARVHQRWILEKRLRVFSVDASGLARDAGLAGRVGMAMQACFLKLSGLFPAEEAAGRAKALVEKAFGSKGEKVIERNLALIRSALDAVRPVRLGESADSGLELEPPVSSDAPDFVQRITARIIAGEGDLLPVSALPPDGTFPPGTARFEHRNLADEIPVWNEDLCVQCGKCALVCPHAAIRTKAWSPNGSAAPAGFKSLPFRGKGLPEGTRYTVQVGPEDCTGCRVCVEVCPAEDRATAGRKSLEMAPQAPVREIESERWRHFLALPEADRRRLRLNVVGESQILQPLFDASGACAGCGETPYLKLLTQLFGDRMVVANATGCSSIYGGNLPTTPWSTDADGRGPAWANSLFEDNAEFGLGLRLAADARRRRAEDLLRALGDDLDGALVHDVIEADARDEAGFAEARARVARLARALAAVPGETARRLEASLEDLLPRQVWIVGGDGWAYDIGFGGLDHVLASGADVKILVMDTEVYSNTGGQRSKASPVGVTARFAASGKKSPKKDLALFAMAYPDVYVARVALGASDTQTLRALREAAAHRGPAIVIAYAHCVAHGIDMSKGMNQQVRAVVCGHWPLLRRVPAADGGRPKLHLDSPPPKGGFDAYVSGEGRYQALMRRDPELAKQLIGEAERAARDRRRLYETLARQMAEPEGG